MFRSPIGSQFSLGWALVTPPKAPKLGPYCQSYDSCRSFISLHAKFRGLARMLRSKEGLLEGFWGSLNGATVGFRV